MGKELIANNARHEAGHWITGWIFEKASKDIVIATTTMGDSYCERAPHPDFSSLQQINTHLGNRIINLLSGAKAESLVCGEFNNVIYMDLISDYKGAWPDFFIAGELFRYYYRSLCSSERGSFQDEWNRLLAKTEEIIKQYEVFIINITNEAVSRRIDENGLVTISQVDALKILERSQLTA
ncbi:hypothetical protein VC136_06700 [Citrobacter freundii]|nr:hypothetical protein [Citrobacter freundii]MEB2764152.1 hypothetical protein [Citrobacter freundii]